MKKANQSLPNHILRREANAYDSLGVFSLMEGTKGGAKIARNISEAIGYTEGIALAECNIVRAKATYEGRSTALNEELVEKQRKVYELSVKEEVKKLQWRQV